MSSGTDRNEFRREKGVNKISKDRLDMTQNGKSADVTTDRQNGN